MENRLNLAKEISRIAGDKTLEYFKKPDLAVESKNDGTPVTQADREAEIYLREAIQKSFPNDSLFGEEFGTTDGTSEWKWVIDPIDGTESFSRGVPLYGVLIGLEKDDVPVAGVINMPAIGEFLWGATGMGVHWTPNQGASEISCHISDTQQLNDAMILTSGTKYFDSESLSRFHNVVDKCKRDRSWGDCYGHAMVITGRADALIEQGVSRWDLSAIYPLIIEAGGSLSDFEGIVDIDSRKIISSNGHLHKEILETLSK